MVIVDITHETAAVVVPGLIDTHDKADDAFRLVEAARGCTSCAANATASRPCIRAQ
jgi:hypothetical protein